MQTRAPIQFITTTSILLLFLALGIWGSVAQKAHAQLAMPSYLGAEIELEPRYPRPNQEFTARLINYSGNPSRDTVIWYIDGVRQEAGLNQSTITLTAPILGTPIRIEAQTLSSSGKEGRAIAAFTPSAIDLVVEGDTTAPYFYAGRRIPSSGSPVRLSAVTHVFDATGKRISPDNLIFHWSINDVLMLEGKGKNVYTFTSPNLSDSNISLTVETEDGRVQFTSLLALPLIEPSLQFYIHNPLTGLSRNAIENAYVQVTDETTLRAEPYFVSQNVYEHAEYGWSLDENPVPKSSNDPQMLTLQKSGTGGISHVGFSLQNLSALAQYVTGIFTIEFK